MVSTVCSQVVNTESELKYLNQLDNKEFREKVSLLYDSLRTVADYESKMKMADALFDLTAKKDPVAHIHSLLFRASNSKGNPIALFNQAYNLAKKYGSIDDINDVEHIRAIFYMNRQQYDSAMVFILRYRDNVGPDTTGEGYREIINLLGDIYYQAEIYDKARQVYTELLHQYEKEGQLNYFRPYVLMDNIGQIFRNEGDIKQAREWFTRSLLMAEKHLKTSYRNNTIGYIKIRLAETALLDNNIDEAGQLLQDVAAYPKHDIYEDVKQEWIYQEASLLLEQGKPAEAKELAEQLVPGGKYKYSEYRFVPGIYHLLSQIDEKLELYPVAGRLEKRYNMIEDSLRNQRHLTRSMIILAGKNEELSKLKLAQAQQKSSSLTKGVVILILILFVILLLYSRLYNTKLELVRKIMENTPKPEVPDYNLNINEKERDREEIIQQNSLIEKLKDWMETEKPFLEPGLTISDVAQHLQTNRTYLSKAINGQLRTNFPGFINDYRISESIRLIRSGFAQDHTQEALAQESGFTGRNVFTAAFKKHTGVVPSFFIANYQKWNVKKEKFVE